MARRNLRESPVLITLTLTSGDPSSYSTPLRFSLKLVVHSLLDVTVQVPVKAVIYLFRDCCSRLVSALKVTIVYALLELKLEPLSRDLSS